MNEISIYSIPFEIFRKHIILPYLVPYDNYDFKKFLSYREVSRSFYTYFTDKIIIRKIQQYYGIMYVKNINEREIESWKYIQKLTNQFYNDIYPPDLIDAFDGLENILKLPVLYGGHWYVVNKLYTMKTEYINSKHDPWELLKKKMTAPIMRGCDEYRHHFIAFRYYNYTQKCYQLEILYEGNMKLHNRYIWTYVGEGTNCFLGNVSIVDNVYRALTLKNWLMLKYIMRNKKMFVADIPDYTKFPPGIRLPHCPYNDDWYSDEESDDEIMPDYTLRKINHQFANLLSLDY